MSALIGNVKGPDNNSPHDAAQVSCSLGGVELWLFEGTGSTPSTEGTLRTFNPIAARNLAALLVRASEEADRMARAREEPSGL